MSMVPAAPSPAAIIHGPSCPCCRWQNSVPHGPFWVWNVLVLNSSKHSRDQTVTFNMSGLKEIWGILGRRNITRYLELLPYVTLRAPGWRASSPWLLAQICMAGASLTPQVSFENISLLLTPSHKGRSSHREMIQFLAFSPRLVLYTTFDVGLSSLIRGAHHP
jgi:hypothetical protein